MEDKTFKRNTHWNIEMALRWVFECLNYGGGEASIRWATKNYGIPLLILHSVRKCCNHSYKHVKKNVFPSGLSGIPWKDKCFPSRLSGIPEEFYVIPFYTHSS